MKPKALSQELKFGDCCRGQNFPARLLCFSEVWLSTAPNMDILVLTSHWRIKETSSRWLVNFNWVVVHSAYFLGRRKERKRKTQTILWDNSSCVSCVFACLVNRGTEWLCFGLSFQWCVYSKQPWKTETTSPSGTQRRHAYCPCKRLGSCNTPVNLKVKRHNERQMCFYLG